MDDLLLKIMFFLKPFFEKKGFQTVKEQKVTLKPFFGKKVALKKVELTNFLMEKIKHV